MRQGSTVVVAGLSLLLAFGGVPARADDPAPVEKVFVLKNGRRIRGTILSQNSQEYSIRTEGGKATIPKTSIGSIEDPPPPPKPFLEPGKEPVADTPPSPAPSSGTNAAGVAPGSPASATAALATDADMANAKKALQEVPPDDPRDPSAADLRQKALEQVAKRNGLPALVAVAVEPLTPARPKAPVEQKLALALVVTAPDRSRPLLAIAIRDALADKGTTPGLLQDAVATTKDDDKGTLETAIGARIAGLAEKGAPIETFASMLALIATSKSLPVIYKTITSQATVDLAALEKTALDVLAHQRPVDPSLAALDALLDPNKLPPYPQLSIAFDLLALSRGEMATKAGLLLDTLESTPPAQRTDAHKACLKRAYAALGAMNTSATRLRLKSSLESATTSDARLAVLAGMAKLKVPDDGPEPALVQTLVRLMGDVKLTDGEVAAFGAALEASTGQKLGTNLKAWRDYSKTNFGQ